MFVDYGNPLNNKGKIYPKNTIRHSVVAKTEAIRPARPKNTLLDTAPIIELTDIVEKRTVWQVLQSVDFITGMDVGLAVSAIPLLILNLVLFMGD